MFKDAYARNRMLIKSVSNSGLFRLGQGAVNDEIGGSSLKVGACSLKVLFKQMGKLVSTIGNL